MVVVSKTSYDKLPKDLKCKVIKSTEISIDIDDINIFIKELSKTNINHVVSFGSGKVVDFCKYISHKLNLEMTCYITVLSNNVFSTDKVCLESHSNNKKAEKITLNAKAPEKIIYDYSIIKSTPKYFSLFGFADVLSIYTALNDWQLADNAHVEKINTNIYNIAKSLLDSSIHTIDNLHKCDDETLMYMIFELLLFSGYITNIYGTGRPESASEHIFSKQLELLCSSVPHGLSVSFGILIMSSLQKNNFNYILGIIDRLDILKYAREFGVSIGHIQEAYGKSQARVDRYTILDEVSKELLQENVFKEIEKRIS